MATRRTKTNIEPATTSTEAPTADTQEVQRQTRPLDTEGETGGTTIALPPAAVEPVLAQAEEGGAVISLPDADAPIETPQIRAYKTPGGLNPSKVTAGSPCPLVYSDDGGMTNVQSTSNYVIGRPVDLALQFITSELDDVPVHARLHLGMTDQDGMVCEFNINCLSSSRTDDSLYVPGPARTLIGSLNEISLSEEDAKSFFDACKIGLVYGKRTKFFSIGVAHGDRWVNVSRDSYRMGPSSADELISMIKQIKQRFQAMHLMSSGAAVYGESILRAATGEVQTTLDTETTEVPF